VGGTRPSGAPLDRWPEADVATSRWPEADVATSRWLVGTPDRLGEL
jgi:hypothetical protein